MQVKKLQLPKKPFTKKLMDDVDYYKLFDLIESQFGTCYLLESIQLSRQQDRYVTIGFDPFLIISAKQNAVTLQGKIDNIKEIISGNQKSEVSLEVENPYYFLREIFPNDLFAKTRQGGLLGFFSYESVNYFEPSLDLPEDPDFGQFKLGLYTDGLVYDITTGTLEYYYYLEDRSNLIEQLIQKLDSQTKTTEVKLEKVIYLGDSTTQKQHEEMINDSLKEINAGNTFQIEVGFKTKYEIKGRKKLIYDKIRQVNPSPYMFYFKFEEQVLFGASPEILIVCNDNQLLTTPAAGTIKRGKTELEDIQLARELLNNPKEIAEHNMLVDLHRNDIGRISTIGSVKVQDLMYIVKYSHVQHIVSDVVGTLDKKYDCFDVLASILPGGVLSGAPKIETIKIIARNEKVPRGPYGGAAGRFSFNGDCAFCLPIRSLFCNKDDCFTQTCSGVVLDSTPQREYQEVKKKLEAMRYTIQELT